MLDLPTKNVDDTRLNVRCLHRRGLQPQHFRPNHRRADDHHWSEITLHDGERGLPFDLFCGIGGRAVLLFSRFCRLDPHANGDLMTACQALEKTAGTTFQGGHPSRALWTAYMSSGKIIEEGTELKLDFTKLKKVANCGEDVLPAVAQDITNGEILIVGYANQLALDTALECGMATFWSTSRNELWIKGKTSGDYLKLEEVRVNCEQNSVLYLVTLAGKGSCHTKDTGGQARSGCYYRRLNKNGRLEFLEGKA